MYRSLFLGCFFAVSAVASSSALNTEKVEKKTADMEYVVFDSADPTSVQGSMEISLRLKFKVAEGFHIQANPASTPQLIPTTVTLPAPNSIEVGTPMYPPGKPYRLKSSANEISTYDGLVTVKVPLKTTKVVGAKFPWKGKLRYQACNEKTCFFPKTLEFEFPFQVIQIVQ